MLWGVDRVTPGAIAFVATLVSNYFTFNTAYEIYIFCHDVRPFFSIPMTRI